MEVPCRCGDVSNGSRGLYGEAGQEWATTGGDTGLNAGRVGGEECVERGDLGTSPSAWAISSRTDMRIFAHLSVRRRHAR